MSSTLRSQQAEAFSSADSNWLGSLQRNNGAVSVAVLLQLAQIPLQDVLCFASLCNAGIVLREAQSWMKRLSVGSW